MARFSKSLIARLCSSLMQRIVNPAQSRAEIAPAAADLGIAGALERFRSQS